MPRWGTPCAGLGLWQTVRVKGSGSAAQTSETDPLLSRRYLPHATGNISFSASCSPFGLVDKTGWCAIGIPLTGDSMVRTTCEGACRGYERLLPGPHPLHLRAPPTGARRGVLALRSRGWHRQRGGALGKGGCAAATQLPSLLPNHSHVTPSPMQDRFNAAGHSAPQCVEQLSHVTAAATANGGITASWTRPLTLPTSRGFTNITVGASRDVIAAWSSDLIRPATPCAGGWPEHVFKWKGKAVFE